MTRTEFDEKYRLVQQVTPAGVRTFHAVAATGAVTMAHFLDENAAGLLARIDLLEPERRKRVLDILEVDGTPVVVTRFILDFESFPAWLGAGSAEAATPPPAEPAPSAEPGEFTRMFARPTASPPATPVQEVPPPPPPPPAPAAEPGEFTRIFAARAPEVAPPPAPAPEPPSVPLPEPEPRAAPILEDAPRPEPAAGPGEFTRQFQALAPQPPTPQSHPAPRVAPPSPPLAPPAAPSLRPPTPRLDAPPAAPPPQPPVAPPPAAPAAPEPGDFTRVFGRLQTPGTPAPEAPRWSPLAPQDYARKLQEPAAAPPPAPTPVAPMAPLGAAGPSEYTRVVSAIPVAPPPPAATPPAASVAPAPPAAPPAAPPKRWPWLVGVVLVVFAAVALVFGVALRRPVPTKPARPAVPRVSAPAGARPPAPAAAR